MAYNPGSNRTRSAPNRASPADLCCEFKNEAEQRNALVSYDLRIVGCPVAGVLTLAIYALTDGSMVRLISRTLGRI